MNPVSVTRGESPVILGLPHCGTFVPPEIFSRFNARGQRLADTDWHVDRLYAGLLEGATTVSASFHRYVIDANRDPADSHLYPGQNTTGLCPRTDFEGEPIYEQGCEPDDGEIASRIKAFHAPYHGALQAEIERVKALHGAAILYDCHSIRSRIPFLFDGQLPDFNIGTFDGRSCAPALADAVSGICRRAQDYTSVLNGRFKGGWTTRHYGSPASGVHAIQMELTERTHLQAEEAPFAYDEAKAGRLRDVLGDVLAALDRLGRSGVLA